MSWWGGSSSKAKAQQQPTHVRRNSGSSSSNSAPSPPPPATSAAPPTQPVQVPVNGSSSNGHASSSNKWGAGVSPRSVSAMEKLEAYSDQLDELEAQVRLMKAVLDGDGVTRAQVLEAKDQVAQLNGTLERIQYTGVDSIVTAELDTGREMAKNRRKSLNRRCDELREKVLESSGVITKLLGS